MVDSRPLNARDGPGDEVAGVTVISCDIRSHNRVMAPGDMCSSVSSSVICVSPNTYGGQ